MIVLRVVSTKLKSSVCRLNGLLRNGEIRTQEDIAVSLGCWLSASAECFGNLRHVYLLVVGLLFKGVSTARTNIVSQFTAKVNIYLRS
jgi:hypothetical protein